MVAKTVAEFVQKNFILILAVVIALYLFKPRKIERFLTYQERRFIAKSGDYYKYRQPNREVGLDIGQIRNIRKNQAEIDNYLRYQRVDTNFLISPEESLEPSVYNRFE